MSVYRRWEIVCALLALGWGVVLLALVYLSPVVVSTSADPYHLTTQPGFSAQAAPYIVAVGLPVLGIIAGAVLVGVAPSVVARSLLWLATAMLIVETGVAAASFGLGLVPIVSLGVCASVVAYRSRREPT